MKLEDVLEYIDNCDNEQWLEFCNAIASRGFDIIQRPRFATDYKATAAVEPVKGYCVIHGIRCENTTFDGFCKFTACIVTGH